MWAESALFSHVSMKKGFWRSQFWWLFLIYYELSENQNKMLVFHSVLGWSRRCGLIQPPPRSQATSRSPALLGLNCKIISLQLLGQLFFIVDINWHAKKDLHISQITSIYLCYISVKIEPKIWKWCKNLSKPFINDTQVTFWLWLNIPWLYEVFNPELQQRSSKVCEKRSVKSLLWVRNLYQFVQNTRPGSSIKRPTPN